MNSAATPCLLLGLTLALLLALTLAGCGGASQSGDQPQSAAAEIAAADQVNLEGFPQTDGKKTFADIQKEAAAQQDANLLPAANDFVAGRRDRLPFGLFDADRNPVWGPTAMYFSTGTDEPAQGPIAASAHSLDVPEKFRSETSSGDYGTLGSGFYTATFTSPEQAKKLNVLTLTKTDGAVQAAATALVLAKDDPSPAPGEPAIAIDTPTLDDVNGDASKIDTRVPPDTMHEISLKDALKKDKPIVLIFATPALCASRVCGPVVDVASEVQAAQGDDVIFIHNEIFEDNDANKDYLPQVTAYGLTSEPFTFVIAPDGKIVEQLQGPFDAAELEAAIAKAKR